MTGLVVAGTDTDAGKTYAVAALVAWLRAQGRDAAPMKPIQTGASRTSDGAWAAPDLDFVLNVAGPAVDTTTYAAMAPNCFAPAASPHLAARLDGSAVDMAAISAGAARLARQFDPVIVEGAGGLLVPIDDHGDTLMVDVLGQLGWPVLLVGRAGLGTLNHTLLSLEALRARHIAVAGTLLVATTAEGPPDWLAADNVATLDRLGGVPCFGVLEHQPAVTRDGLIAAVEARPGLTAYLTRG